MIHFKYLLYLQLDGPRYIQNDKEAFPTNENIQLCVKENTFSISSLVRIVFDVNFTSTVQI